MKTTDIKKLMIAAACALLFACTGDIAEPMQSSDEGRTSTTCVMRIVRFV